MQKEEHEEEKEVYMKFSLHILMDEVDKDDIVADIERTLKHYCKDAGFFMDWEEEKEDEPESLLSAVPQGSIDEYCEFYNVDAKWYGDIDRLVLEKGEVKLGQFFIKEKGEPREVQFHSQTSSFDQKNLKIISDFLDMLNKYVQ